MLVNCVQSRIEADQTHQRRRLAFRVLARHAPRPALLLARHLRDHRRRGALHLPPRQLRQLRLRRDQPPVPAPARRRRFPRPRRGHRRRRARHEPAVVRRQDRHPLRRGTVRRRHRLRALLGLLRHRASHRLRSCRPSADADSFSQVYPVARVIEKHYMGR